MVFLSSLDPEDVAKDRFQSLLENPDVPKIGVNILSELFVF